MQPMTLKSRKLVRPTSRTPKEDAGPVSFARIYVEVDAGTGQRVTFDLKIAVHSHNASDFAPVVGALETSSAELSGEQLPDQQPDDPEYGPYFVGLFGERVRARRPKRARLMDWRIDARSQAPAGGVCPLQLAHRRLPRSA